MKPPGAQPGSSGWSTVVCNPRPNAILFDKHVGAPKPSYLRISRFDLRTEVMHDGHVSFDYDI
jgi:hypothetical protein